MTSEIENLTPKRSALKRFIDILVSLVGCVTLSPLGVLIALLIKLDSRGPVFYLSQRLGRGGRPFAMYKFRSMHQNSPAIRNPDHSYHVAEDDPRVTRVGRVLRLGFDELPQLINVLKGDMSLVGPRPDPVDAVNYYSSEERQRLRMRPGITGLAQVMGRNDIPWQERLVYDQIYVEHQSLGLDALIAAWTIFEFIPPLRGRLLPVQRKWLRMIGLEDAV